MTATAETPLSTAIAAAPITSVLVANRGEIARRVFATCRRTGRSAVAVFSDPDADAPFVAEADAAVRLPGEGPADTYLRGDKVIAAALAAGADAIHPGYGFLSENAGFARAVLAAGLTWIGPPPAAIDAMGSKIESKKLMAAAGVPVLPELDPAAVTEADLPVLIKASAGGGGRGMRIVGTLADLPEAVESARREARSAFGDEAVFCERYLPRGRHIEVQVMADAAGTVWAVGERECSLQRRHQKVVEEAPSPLVEQQPGMREKLFDAARTAAGAISYLGAGTVEFLAEDDGSFWFLEMNTRLQVEHPVTEATSGLDLVDLQLRMAEGELLAPEPPASTGHAIEVRLYAEEPARDWSPRTGLLHRFEVPSARVAFDIPAGDQWVRLDSGVEDGSLIGVHYDPMLAKVIARAPSRRRAAALLADALDRAVLHGPINNRELLIAILRESDFLAGRIDTAYFDTHPEVVAADRGGAAMAESAAAVALADAHLARSGSGLLTSVPAGWRSVAGPAAVRRYRSGEDEVAVRYRRTRPGWTLEDLRDVAVIGVTPDRVDLETDGVRRSYRIARYGASRFVDSPCGSVHLEQVKRFVDPSTAVASGSLLAPLPGAVVRVAVAVGDRVEKGTSILWLEAMKMEHVITAPESGVVKELPVQVGSRVEVDAVLAVIEPVDNAEQENDR